MKRNALRRWMKVCGISLLVTAGNLARADQAATPAPTVASGKNYTGTIMAVDAKEGLLTLHGSLFGSKKFTLGDNSTFVTLDKNAASVNDLRAGQKVLVIYQDAHGVLAANHVEQLPMRYEGSVKIIDADKGAMKLHLRATDKEFRISEGCKVTLRGGRSGELADIKPGHYVTITYETPTGLPVVRQIAQTSESFTGTLTAIDLTERTARAKAAFGAKKFSLADNCAIVINGKTGGQMRDLRPGDRFIFNYDEVNGVNVANRIADTSVPETPATAQAGSPVTQ